VPLAQARRVRPLVAQPDLERLQLRQKQANRALPAEAPVAGKVVHWAPTVVSRRLLVVRPASGVETFSRRSTVRQCLRSPN
jgi:hypothetical protein